MRLASRVLACAAVVGVLGPAADAHLGGTTAVDQLVRITRQGRTLHVSLELDVAEYPALALRKRFDARPRDLRISQREERVGLRNLAREIRRALTLELDGERLRLKLRGAGLDTPDNTTGPVPLKLTFRFTAALPAAFDGGRVTLENRHDPGRRTGFIRAYLDPGAGFTAVGEPAVEGLLRRYEERNRVLLENGKVKPLPAGEKPPQLRKLTWQVRRAAAAVRPPATPVAKPRQGGATGATGGGARAVPKPRFTDRQTGVFYEFFKQGGALSLVILLAFVYGAWHALQPGHGKAVAGAFLIGTHGTIKNAVVLGLAVTATHTSTVFALAIALEVVTAAVNQEAVVWWLQLLSGGLILILGLAVFIRYLLALAAGEEVPHGHHHAPGLPGHHHDHARGADVSASAPAGAPAPLPAPRPPGLWQIITVGIAGGIVPCPTAMFVVLISYQFHALGLGILLAAVFSLGMAIVLVSLGVLAVKGYNIAERYGRQRVRTLFRILPVLSGAFIASIGALIILAVYGLLKLPGVS